MFGRPLNILTFAGIRIGIDVSWIFIAILLSWTLAAGNFPFYYPGLDATTYWAMGIVGMLSLFVCIVLHELGHAMVAKHYKLPISEITLFIFGGVAKIEKEPATPKVEFLVAIAGPIVSAVLVLIMLLLTNLGEQLGWPVFVKGVTSYLASINTIIVIFNLIPAFPLDGGRVLRAFLWWWKDSFAWATKIAATLGWSFGVFLIIFGIFLFIMGDYIPGIWLAVIGLFLKSAASSSQTQFYVSQALQGEKVTKFMKKEIISVSPDISVQEFVEQYVYKSHHHLYPVADEGILLGYISLREVKTLVPEEWLKTPVKKVMVWHPQTVTPNTSALEALSLMQQSEQPTLLVVEEKRLVGMLTANDLFKQISLKLDLEKFESNRPL